MILLAYPLLLVLGFVFRILLLAAVATLYGAVWMIIAFGYLAALLARWAWQRRHRRRAAIPLRPIPQARFSDRR